MIKLINNNLSPLPFYDSITFQNHRKDYAFSQIYSLITYRNMLLPFQVVLSRGENIISVKLHIFDTDKVLDITANILENGLTLKKNHQFIILQYPGTLPIVGLHHEGRYYLEIQIDNEYIYSDVFTSCNNIDNYLLLEYRNSYNFRLKNGIIDFSDNFKFKCYLNTQIGKPDYLFEEETTDRMGYSFIESQVSKKVYKFTFVAPEYLCDALRIVRLCEDKQITSRGISYDVTIFNIEPDWEDQGDLATVNCEFETDTVIANIGGYAQEEQSKEYNNDFNNDYKTI